jgi:dihydroorotate dehydrogenase
MREPGCRTSVSGRRLHGARRKGVRWHAWAADRFERPCRTADEGQPEEFMATAYDAFFSKVLVRTDAETAHHVAFRAIRSARPVLSVAGRRVRATSTPVEAMGLRFPGVLGLAAGFDKNALGIDALAALGFSFVEIGTVTGEPQPGNPRPRLFRLPQDHAIVNRMGFNNDGAEVVAERLRRRAARPRKGQVVLGVNIGKTKAVPEDEAVADYEKSTRLLAPLADYLVVNVSSPNTPGLRDLQAVEKLRPLLTAVRAAADSATAKHVPLLVKIAPDLSDDDVLAVADLALELGLDGIVATNTTISRAGLASAADAVEAVGVGGLSGAPLTQRADDVMRLLRDRVGPELTLIGVGGIGSVEQARARLAAGATLLQGYTGFVYGGPAWPGRMQRALATSAVEVG